MKKRGPWLIKKSTVKYKNSWITVREDQVIRSDGKKGLYGVVLKADGAQTLPLDKDGYVYLVRPFCYGLGEWTLEVPGGAVNSGEKPLSAARRELREETGIIAGKWTSLGRVHGFTDIMNSAGHIFLAEGLSFVERHLDLEEQGMKLVRVKFEKAFQMVIEGTVTHAQSCVVILKAHHYLNNPKRSKKSK